ncbi:hypothetical protein L6452_01883 [Arctium lappa]|uniref:Uncharacterized protein n=1 Tax=Arctium lappa TaxID=4217 RepID=A0ACB9FIV0_ARCLA|nr:hypothetical protein L6452_01883 [Arctium lappa]
MRRGGSRKLWWLIPSCTHKKRFRTESRLDADEMFRAELRTINEEEMLMTELTTINEEPDTYNQNNGTETPRKRVKTGKKKQEDMGRVFTTQFSLKNSYALFLNRMTSSRSFSAY